MPALYVLARTLDSARFGAGREAIRLALEDDRGTCVPGTWNIESRPVWKPMPLQPVFRDCEVAGGAVAEALFRDGLCLPSGTALTEAELARVAAVVRGTMGRRPVLSGAEG